jgi:hypothetical protein
MLNNLAMPFTENLSKGVHKEIYQRHYCQGQMEVISFIEGSPPSTTTSGPLFILDKEILFPYAPATEKQW